jgi:molecular chaperone GrpE
VASENDNVASIPPEASSPVESTEAVELAAQITALTKERDDLLAEKAELSDRLLRRQAEFENFRRRTDRERSEFIQYACADLVREVVPILDDFDRAVKAPTSDETYAKGVELIRNRLHEALKKQGLEPIEAAGKPFDPHVHEAVNRVQTDEVEDQTVLEEHQRGYNFRGKLLRPAMVSVAGKS